MHSRHRAGDDADPSGPWPLLPALLVKPGMTGLWQVSGRSSLTCEEPVRLDLRYVEIRAPAPDLLILWKTVGAVLRSRGAYRPGAAACGPLRRTASPAPRGARRRAGPGAG